MNSKQYIKNYNEINWNSKIKQLDNIERLIDRIESTDRTITKRYIVPNPSGLCANPSCHIVKALSKFQSDATIENLTTGSKVDGKSIMGIMTLEAAKGVILEIVIKGIDAREAMKEMDRLFLVFKFNDY